MNSKEAVHLSSDLIDDNDSTIEDHETQHRFYFCDRFFLDTARGDCLFYSLPNLSSIVCRIWVIVHVYICYPTGNLCIQKFFIYLKCLFFLFYLNTGVNISQSILPYTEFDQPNCYW